MGRIVLNVMGGFWVAFGLFGLLAPAALLDDLGIGLGTADAVAEIRAMYGGAQIGIGALFLYCARSEARVRTGLVALAAIAGGLAAARSVGIAVDGARGGLIVFALAVEITALGLACFALARHRAGEDAPPGSTSFRTSAS